MNKFSGTFVLLIVILGSCFPDDEAPVGFQDYQIERLLRSDSTKTWDRFSRIENGFEFSSDSCNLDDIIVFQSNASGNQVTTIVLNSICSDSIILQGSWEVLQGEGSLTADSVRVAYMRNQLVLDTLYDENDSTRAVGIDTSSIKVPDTVIWVLNETTSQVLTFSFLDTLLFPFYVEDVDTTIFFLDTIPLEITDKYRFSP